MSSSSVSMSRLLVSTSGYDGVPVRISTDISAEIATTSKYEVFGGFNSISSKLSDEAGWLSKLAGTVHGPLLFRYLKKSPA